MIRLFKQPGFLRIGGGSAPRLEEDGRVLLLFRNRAELKKAYGELQDEIHRFKDRIKQQEGATARVQEMLEALEQRLAATETGFHTLVFYQLRDLWSKGRELIVALIAELSQQQEERERRQFLAEFNHRRFERRQAIQGRLNQAETAAADVRSKLADLQQARERASRWWHYFKRRDLERRIYAMTAELSGANTTLAEARSASAALEAEQPPEFPGLSVEARRAINLAGIAYAEALCVRLARTRLVALAKEAIGRREPVDTYGDQATCSSLMADIARALAIIQQKDGIANEIKQRSERLKVTARYRGNDDAVPTEDSIAPARGEEAAAILEDQGQPSAPHVLGEDIWDLYRVLLH
ncbi:MAG: hypothetical protein ABIT36_02090 [Steroidobacteraceae bacterium]